jgi:DNA primase
MIGYSTIYAIRQLPIDRIIAQYISIKKDGSILKGCCPFHNEKTPSFVVYPKSNTYKCFGCGASGDVIQFVKDIKKVDFEQAIEILAQENGIAIERTKQTEEQKKQQEQMKDALAVTAYANKYFIKKLELEQEAKDYLKNRITEDSIAKWQIGYAPNGNILKKLAEEKGRIELFYNAGMLGKNEANGTHYDRFQERISIPILNYKNEVISFGGRTTTGKEPKYLNGSETDIFKKSNTLFGINHFKAIDNTAILVEGYFDVIGLHEKGCANTVGTMGTALTAQHVQLLEKLVDAVIIMRDGDAAGVKATLKDIDILLPSSLELKVFPLSNKIDPFDFANAYTKDKLVEHIHSESEDAVMWKAKHIYKQAKTPIQKNKAIDEIKKMLCLLKNDITRHEYMYLISDELNIESSFLSNLPKEKNEPKPMQIISDDTYLDWMTDEDKKHFNKHRFAIRIHKEETGYYFPNKNWEPEQATNFVIKPLYLIKSQTEPRRMVEVIGWDKYNNITIEEVIDLKVNEVNKKDPFECKLAESNPFITYENFTISHLKKLFNKILFEFTACDELRTLGFQPEQFWAFSDACYIYPTKEKPQGERIEYNEYGVVVINGNGYLSESKNKRVLNMRADNNQYENDLYFIYKEPKINFKEWCELMLDAYQDKAWLGISFAIVTILRDSILHYTKIPHLHCYGEKGSGKSEFAESIFYLFFSGKDSTGEMYKPFNLTGGGTPYSFHNRLERFRNVPQILNEYDDTNILPEFFDAIKASFDGEGRTRGSGIKNKTETMKRNATLILVGQKIGNRDDNSVLTRSITIEFLKPKDRPEAQIRAHRKLKLAEKDGLSGLVIEILSHREIFVKQFGENFMKEVLQMQNKMQELNRKVEIRIVNSICTLKLAFNIISEQLSLPISKEDIELFAFRKCLEMHEHLQSTDGLSEFFKILEYLVERDEVELGWDIKVESTNKLKLRKSVDGKQEDTYKTFEKERRILYIKLSQVHQAYAVQFNRSNRSEKALGEKTILTYMSSQSYWYGLVHSTQFVSDRTGKIKHTSAYALDYDMLNINIVTENIEDDRYKEQFWAKVTKGPTEIGDKKIKFNIERYLTIDGKTDRMVYNMFADENLKDIINESSTYTFVGLTNKNKHGYYNMDVEQILSKDDIAEKPDNEELF